LSDISKRAGRGGVAVLAAKVYFIVFGLVQQALLKRVLGLAGYGALALVLAPMNVVNNVVVASSTQGVSRAVVGAKDGDASVFRGAMRIHVRLALIAMVGFAAAAPLVAWLELAPHILVPLLAASAIVGLYGVYAPMVGAINGRGQFQRQATLDATFATMRTAGMIGVAWLLVRRGLGVLGAVVGFAAAALAILPLALRFAGTGKPGNGLPVRPYLAGLWPIVVAQLATNLVMQSDISLLGRFLSASSASVFETKELAHKGADEWVGVYRACQLFAFLPYQLLMSVTQVLFPMLARAKADGDLEAVRTYVARGARLAAIAGGGIVAVIVGAPGTLLAFAYGADVAERGASTLRVLGLAQGMFALMGVGATVLASLGHERRAARITAAALAASVLGCVLLVPRADFGTAQLERTALCVTGAMALALGLAAASVRGVTGAFLGWPTAVRVGAAVLAAAYAGTYVPIVSRLMASIVALCIFLAYAVVLVLTREVKRADVAAFTAMLRRR
jgi:stage V sporulation protein B